MQSLFDGDRRGGGEIEGENEKKSLFFTFLSSIPKILNAFVALVLHHLIFLPLLSSASAVLSLFSAPKYALSTLSFV